MSPIERALHKEKVNKKAETKNKLKIFNIISFFAALAILVSYTLIVNSYTGGALEIQKLEKEKNTLRAEVGNQANFVNALKVPQHIRAQVENEMVKTQKVSYLKNGDSQVAVLKK